MHIYGTVEPYVMRLHLHLPLSFSCNLKGYYLSELGGGAVQNVELSATLLQNLPQSSFY